MVLKLGLVGSVESRIETVIDSKSDFLQGLRVRIKRDLAVVGIYVIPETKDKETTAASDKLYTQVDPATLVLGDLNARDRGWDTADNDKGRVIKHFTRHFNLNHSH